MKFDFGEVISKAWKITWQYKVLWIFGIFSACSRGGGGSGGCGGGGGDGSGQYDSLAMERIFNEIGQWINENWWIVAVAILAIIILTLISIFLGSIGRIGLIRGTLQTEAGAETLVFGELFSGSMPYFWRVFGLSFLIGLAVLILILPLVAFGVLSAGVGFLCILPLICLLIPVAIAVNLILEMANVAIVKENLGMLDAFKRGWEILRNNLGAMIVMGLILFIISFVIGLVIAIPLIAAIVPVAIGVSVGDLPSANTWLIAGICIAVFLPVAILINGVYYTFYGAAWTLTYNRLTATPEPPAVPAEPNA